MNALFNLLTCYNFDLSKNHNFIEDVVYYYNKLFLSSLYCYTAKLLRVNINNCVYEN